MTTALWAIGLMAVTSIVSAFATFFLKVASSTMSLSIDRLMKNWRLILGLFLYGISTVLSLAALRGGELSVLYPIVALQYVWTCIISVKYLDEHMPPLKWVGVGLIIVGVLLVSMKG